MIPVRGGDAAQITYEGAGFLYGVDSKWVYYGRDLSSSNAEGTSDQTEKTISGSVGEVLRKQFALAGGRRVFRHAASAG